MKIPAHPEKEPQRRAALLDYHILDTPAEPAFDALTRLVAHVLKVPTALVSLVDSDRQWFKSRYGLEISETPRDISFCGHVVAADLPLIVEDASADERFSDNPLVTGAPRIRFYAGFPLRTPDGLVLGTLCALDSQPHAPSREDLAVLDLLARQAMDQLELRRKARLLAEQEIRLRTVLETAVDAIITIDEQGQIEQLNAAVERNFGYSSEELLGQNIRLLMPPVMREAHDRGMADYLLTGHKKVIGIGRELIAQRKDGSIFPIDAMVSEMRLGERRMFTGILRDATQRKAAERALKDALSDLHTSHDNLLQVLNALDVCVLVLNEDRSVAFANGSFLALCNTDAERVIGTPWTDVLDVDESSRQAIRTMKRLPEVERTRFTIRLVVKGASPRWVEMDLRDDPRNPERLIFFLYDVTPVHELQAKLREQRSDQMVGESTVMSQLYRRVEQVAAGTWTVLVLGETGVGKELVARAIHSASPRRNGPFIAVNCAGLTDSLLSSQLFGHIKGAFSGAIVNQQGFFEAAVGGTLFLDEIGDVSLAVQGALLRALQEKEITRIGETRPRKVDVRIVAATNRDLPALMAAGKFREDLYYRLKGAQLLVPPLRTREGDLTKLLWSFLSQERMLSGKLITGVSPRALEALERHSWPGNVRELRAAIEHAMRCATSRVIELEDLPPELLQGETAPSPTGAMMATGIAGARARTKHSPAEERERLIAALEKCGDNRARTARLLGIGRATLYRRLKELGIEGGGTPVDSRPRTP